MTIFTRPERISQGMGKTAARLAEEKINMAIDRADAEAICVHAIRSTTTTSISNGTKISAKTWKHHGKILLLRLVKIEYKLSSSSKIEVGSTPWNTTISGPL